MRGEIRKICDFAAADWDGCFQDEAENHAYYAAVERLDGLRFGMGGVCIVEDGKVLAVAPYMKLDYRLDTSLQGRGRTVTNWLAARVPGLFSIRALVLGSPLAERCHIGFAPHLTQAQRLTIFAELMATLERHALGLGIGLTGMKDLASPDEKFLATSLAGLRYGRISSLPVAVVDLPFPTQDAYLASLSVKMRADLRRKLRKRKAVRLEMRESIAGLEDEIYALYNATQQKSDVDYGDIEHVPPDYFQAVTQALPGRALYLLYWVEDQLAAFNLLLVEPHRIIDKYVGMRYPLAREHNLYYLRWMDAVDYCLAHKIPVLQSGQTAYREKLRLGARLVGSAIFFKHRNVSLNIMLQVLGKWLAFDAADPTLKGLHYD